MIRKLKSISIAYKINIPLVFIILFGLVIVTINSYLSLQNIEQSAMSEISKNNGIVMTTADREYVQKYVDKTKKLFKQQIWILFIVDTFMLVILIYLLNITFKYPIFKLLKGLKKINKEMKKGKTPIDVYNHNKFSYESHDEMGTISTTINSLLRTMSQTYSQLQKSQKHTSEYINAIYAGGLVSVSDVNGQITYVNEKLCKVSGYTKSELIGKSHNIFRDIGTSRQIYEDLWMTILSGKIYHELIKNRSKNGESFYANTTIIPIKDENEKIIEFIAFRDDVTELINSKKELKRNFLHDPLTNLGNRFKMIADISESSYLAILDIHLFKEINDFYGHEIGDLVIKDLAYRLFENFHKKGMSVYHLSGDEFSVVADKNFISSSEFYKMLKEFLSQNIINELFINNNIQVSTRLTCGIAYEKENIINYADIAHKHAKKINKDILEYSKDINTDEEYRLNLEWTNELKNAISEDRIETYFQPIVNSVTGNIEKYETLMRLIKRDGEVVLPIEFLNIAKKTRIYQELTKIVALKAFNKFSDSEYEFSINLSIEDIMVYDVGSWIFDLALEKKVNNRLIIEIVEAEDIESFEEVENFIREAKGIGMKIAIDDFGTGYCNFEYLIKLNADYLKVDGSLMSEINTNEKLCGVVETIVSFAKKNDIKVIGEFISTQEIYEKTKELGIEYSQGYFLGHPSCELKNKVKDENS